MFPFEQSSVSPFGQTNSVFGQNNSSNNPFSPKPFGSTTPFGSQTDSSIFGGTSTGVFGAAQTPSPFGASCSPAFGSSMPAFGSSSTPAFGSSSTSFGGSSGFGQKPTFGGFGSTIPTSVRKLMEAVAGFGSTIGIGKDLEATQTNPFGSATQPSQLAFGFGSSIFGYSTPLDASSQPAFGSTGAPAFGATSTLAFGATSTPEFGATSTSAFGVTSAPAFGATSTPAFVSTSIPASFGSSSSDVYTRVSHPTITEEDGGTSGQTAKLESISAMPSYKYERFESCFAIAGADYCVIAADFTRDHTKISQLSEKSVIVSCGFQADVKALQVVLSAENLIYERQHNKPMSCPETLRLFCRLRKCHPKCVFVVLGGLDSEGKGWVFTHFGDGVGDPRVGDSSQDSGSRLIMPPILKYKLPAEDVLARLSETEAVGLAKRVFASATHTGDKLEIVVLNASGLRREHVDLRKDCDRRWDKLEVLVQTATGVRSEYMDLRKDCDRRHGQVFSRKRKRNNSAVAESSSV